MVPLARDSFGPDMRVTDNGLSLSLVLAKASHYRCCRVMPWITLVEEVDSKHWGQPMLSDRVGYPIREESGFVEGNEDAMRRGTLPSPV